MLNSQGDTLCISADMDQLASLRTGIELVPSKRGCIDGCIYFLNANKKDLPLVFTEDL